MLHQSNKRYNERKNPMEPFKTEIMKIDRWTEIQSDSQTVRPWESHRHTKPYR